MHVKAPSIYGMSQVPHHPRTAELNKITQKTKGLSFGCCSLGAAEGRVGLWIRDCSKLWKRHANSKIKAYSLAYRCVAWSAWGSADLLIRRECPQANRKIRLAYYITHSDRRKAVDTAASAASGVACEFREPNLASSALVRNTQYMVPLVAPAQFATR